MSAPVLHSNDTILLQASSTRNHIQIDQHDNLICNEPSDHSPRTQFRIIRALGNRNDTSTPIRKGDKVLLKNVHSGNFLSVDGTKVTCLTRNSGPQQAFELFRHESSNAPIRSGSDIWLKAHTGKYIHVDSNSNLGCAWPHTHRNGFQQMVITKEENVLSTATAMPPQQQEPIASEPSSMSVNVSNESTPPSNNGVMNQMPDFQQGIAYNQAQQQAPPPQNPSMQPRYQISSPTSGGNMYPPQQQQQYQQGPPQQQFQQGPPPPYDQHHTHSQYMPPQQVCAQARPNFFFILSVNNNLVLDLDPSTGNVTQAQKTGSDTQLWFYDALSEGVILNKALAGLALDHDIYNHTCVARRKNGLPSQYWSLQSNVLHNRFRHDNEWTLQVPNKTHEPQAQLIVGKFASSEFQKWSFQQHSDTSGTYQGQTGVFLPDPSSVAYNQPLKIKSEHNKNLFLNCSNPHEGAFLNIWTSNSTSDQLFVFSNDGQILMAENPSYCLEINPSSGEVFIARKRLPPGDNYLHPSVIAQKWNVFPVGNSKLISSIANPDMVLSLSGSVQFGKGDTIVGRVASKHERPADQQLWDFETVERSAVSKYVTYDQPLFVYRKGCWDIDKDVLRRDHGRAPIKEWKFNFIRTANQQWIFTEKGYIVSKCNRDLVLTSNGPGRALSLVPIYPSNNLNQKWIIEPNNMVDENGLLFILSAEDTNMCVDSRGYKQELILGAVRKEAGWKVKT